MSKFSCERCFGRAIFVGADGKARCVVCQPKSNDEYE